MQLTQEQAISLLKKMPNEPSAVFHLPEPNSLHSGPPPEHPAWLGGRPVHHTTAMTRTRIEAIANGDAENRD